MLSLMNTLRLVISLFLFISFSRVSVADEFPRKPVKIVVYTKPGGLIDVTARKIAQILENKYLSQPVVVDNKKGAGGIVALGYSARQRPDGHTLVALTSSVISKLVAAKQEKRLDDFTLLSRVVDDYECLIVNRNMKISTLSDLIADAKEKAGKQIWVGPVSKGTDHLFAMKFWNAAGVDGKWVPYKSGGEAIASLLGNHGDVYVGNPQDAQGRPDLQITAVASPEPLAAFPDVPTFASLGLDSLTGESLWRGIALHKNTPPEIVSFWKETLTKLHKDSDWQKFVIEGGAVPVLDTSESFDQMVKAQITQDRELLKKLSS